VRFPWLQVDADFIGVRRHLLALLTGVMYLACVHRWRPRPLALDSSDFPQGSPMASPCVAAGWGRGVSMACTVTFICDACGATGQGVPGDYLHPDPPLGWVWFWGSEMRATGPHACSHLCWNKVDRSPDGKSYLFDSHERRARRDEEVERRRDIIRQDPLSADMLPLHDRTKGAEVFVYFIQRGADGPVKIGYSKNPKGRLSSLQVGFPEPLTLLGVIPGGKPMEEELHRQFGRARIKGEWFTPIAPLMDYVKAKARVP